MTSSLADALEARLKLQRVANEAIDCEELWLRRGIWKWGRITITTDFGTFEADTYRVHLDHSIQFHEIGTPNAKSTCISAGSWGKAER
jgi:hypothetical protein